MYLKSTFLLTLSLFLISCTGALEVARVSQLDTGSSQTQATAFEVAKVVLSRNCVSCHQAGGSAGFARLDLVFEQQYIDAGMILPGDPGGSKLLYRTIHFSGPSPGLKNMPTGNSSFSLADYQYLHSWILGLTQPASELAKIEILAGDNQTAWVGKTTAVNPMVRALNKQNMPMANVTISFLAMNGGSVPTSSIVTGLDGTASPGPWTVGAAGKNNLIISAGSLQVTLSANAIQPAPNLASLQVVAGANQSADSGTLVAINPVFKAVDTSGKPLANAVITFVAGNNSSIMRSSATTDSAGQASPGQWVLGDVGVNVLTAMSGMQQISIQANSLKPVMTPEQRFTEVRKIMSLHCISCHDTGSAVGDLNLQTEGAFVGMGFVIAGNVDQSKIAYRTKYYNGPTVSQRTMPLGLDENKFSSADQKVLENWIKGLAPITRTLAGLQKISGDNQSAQMGKAVSMSPVVRAIDQFGTPMPNVAISFKANNGGRVENQIVVSDTNGLANPGLWTMGQVGANSLVASASNFTIVFNATSTAEAPTIKALVKVQGDNQQREENLPLLTDPIVKVLDQFGNALPGIVVKFSPMNGGQVAKIEAVTGADGMASAGRWTLGPAGPNSLLAVAGGYQVTFVATAVKKVDVPPPGSQTLSLKPSDFIGTGANNSLVVDNSLFSSAVIGGVSALSTNSTATNIHAHWPNGKTLSSYEYTGRMMISDPNSGIGITFMSSYNNKDSYYRLRRMATTQTFELSSHGTSACSNIGPTFNITNNKWYRFKVVTEIMDGSTRVNVKLWSDGGTEPSQSTLSCQDTTSGRFKQGTIGVWSMGPGQKYWADMKVKDLSIPMQPAKFDLAKTVLQKHCISCHSEGKQASFAPLNYSDSNLFIANNMIVPGSIDQSKLLHRTKHYSGPTSSDHNMPTGGDVNKFSVEDYGILVDWVLSLDTGEVLPPNVLPVAKQHTYLLTQKHIQNTLKLSFQIDVEATWEQPTLSLGNSSQLAIDHVLADMEGYFKFTESVAVNQLDKFLSCARANLNDSCLTSTIQKVGKKLFRRNLSTAEVSFYRQIANSQGSQNLVVGSSYAIVGLLNSPNFLYQKFYGDSNGQLTQQEIASRIGFFVMQSNPDEVLIDAAIKGELKSSAQIGLQVDRLLQNPEIRANLLFNYVNESWKLNLVDETATASFFPAQLKALKPNLIKEINLTTRDIALNKGGDLRRLVDNNSTFVNRSLAQHYQLAKIPVNDNTWESVSLNSNRSGLLTSGLALAAHSGNKYTSTTHRGLFVTIDLLCRYVPSPPGDVDDLAEEAGIDFPDTDTVRQRVNKLGTIQPCASCHVKFDPYGMVFENFNAFGQYFTTRYGETVDSTALINNQAVSNPKQLAGVLLTQQNELAQCLFDKMFTFASGYKLGSNITDLLGVYRIDDANKFELATLVKALATHENFRKVEGK